MSLMRNAYPVVQINYPYGDVRRQYVRLGTD